MKARVFAGALIAFVALGAGASSAAGFGTFGAVKTYETGGEVYGIAAGKLNRDRKLDLLVSNDNSGTARDHIRLLVGKGGRKFRSKARIRDPRGPEGIVVARFNRDKRKDFAVAEYADGDDSSGVAIYTQRRKLRFRRARSLNPGPGAWLIETADLNRDGRRDLVTGNFDTDGSDVVTVLLGKGPKGKMRFRPPRHFGGGTGAPIDGLALGRMNGDRRPDVVVSADDCTLMIYVTRANGKLRPPAVMDACAGNTGYGLALGGFDEAPGADVVVPGSFLNSVFSARGDGAGGFAPVPVVQSASTTQASGIAAGDLDRDGELDLAIGNSFAAGGGFAAQLGAGDGSFAEPDVYPGFSSPYVVTLARLNRDRGLDVIAGHSDGIDVFLNRP